MILGGGALGAAAIGAGGAGIFRLHATPRRRPFLTDAHLNALDASALPEPRLLFIGNSMVLRGDLPARVVARAAADGQSLGVATAAAEGARLIETWRIETFREMLTREPWDAVVVQDFTKTPLRAIDRAGSAFAIRAIARAAAPAHLLLYPPFPAAAGNAVYRDAGRLTAVPESPEDYARRSTAHYAALAGGRITVVHVPSRWLEEGEAGFYAPDGHHPSEAGSDFIAGVIWDHLRFILQN